MKTKLILGASLALSLGGFAQTNSFPTPSGIVNVNGVGVITNPTNRLEVHSNTDNHIGIGGTAPVIRFYGGNTVPPGTPSSYSGPYAKIGLATSAGVFVSSADPGDLVIQNIGMSSTPIAGNGKSIIFSSRYQSGNGVEHMRINENGNVGIGTTTPSDSKLQTDVSYTNVQSINVPRSAGLFNTSATQWGTYIGAKATVNNSFTGGPITLNYGLIGEVTTVIGSDNRTTGVSGTGSGGNVNDGGVFQASGTNNPSNAGVSGYADGGTRNWGGYFVATGNSSTTQNIGLYASASGAPGNLAAYFSGDVFCTGSYLPSDKKLKNDIQHFSNMLDKIMLLKPSTYVYKTEEFKHMNLPRGKQLGLIAQELEEVFPELITEINEVSRIDDKGEKIIISPQIKAVQYISLIPVLIAGIQEQQGTIASQQKQLDEQKQMIETLNQKLSSTSGINDITAPAAGFQMAQNEPNPFTHETVVKYTLPQSVSNAFMAVYDLTGKQITTFPVNEKGSSSLTITSEKLAAGIYIYSIVADGKIMDSKRMIVAEK